LLGIAHERFAQVLPCFDPASDKLGKRIADRLKTLLRDSNPFFLYGLRLFVRLAYVVDGLFIALVFGDLFGKRGLKFFKRRVDLAMQVRHRRDGFVVFLGSCACSVLILRRQLQNGLFVLQIAIGFRDDVVLRLIGRKPALQRLELCVVNLNQLF
jgi:hypothetical protein